MPNPQFRHQERDPNDLVHTIHEELNDYANDVAFLRTNTTLRAGRIVASIENALYQDFAQKLGQLGHEDEADEYYRLSIVRERQAGQRGADL